MQCSFHEALSIKYMQLLGGTLQCNFHRSIDMLLGGGGSTCFGKSVNMSGVGGGVGINMPWEGVSTCLGGGGGGGEGFNMPWKRGTCFGGGGGGGIT